MLAHGPIGPTLFRLAAPAVTGMVVMAVYNLVDTFFVGLLRDTAAVAATGIVFPLFQLVGAIGLTFGMGASSVISRRLGEGNHEAAQQTASTALITAVAVGIAFSLTGAIFIRPILTLFGATESILAVAALYGRIIVGGSVFQVANMVLNNLLRAEGAALHSSTGQILGAVLNILLDPIFIFVFDMGVAGAAVATVISQAVSTAYLASFFVRGRGVLTPLGRGHFHPTVGTYAAIMTLGLPTLVRQVLGSVSFGIVNNAAAQWGDSAIAAISVTFRLFMLLLMALIGVAQGLQPLAGYNFGARRFDRVRDALRLAFVVATIVGAVAGVSGYIFAPAIMQIFTPQDASAISMGTEAIRLMSLALVPIGLVIMFGGAFQAMGDGRSALLLASGQQGLFLVPLVIVLPRVWGLTGVFAAQPLGFVLAFLIGLGIMQRSLAAMGREQQTNA